MPASQSNPWRALMPLDAARNEDRDMLALTREEELHVVTNMVAASRVSLLYAASGNGKTSLLHAGVVPFFEARGYVVFTVRPRPPWAPGDPQTAFRSCVLRQLPAVIKRTFDERAVAELDALAMTSENADLQMLVDRVRTLLDALPDDPRVTHVIDEKFANRPMDSVQRLVSDVADLVGRTRPILLILDQFEELFVHFANRAALNQFAEQLAKLWADETMNVRLLFSMREDWVGSMIVLKRLIPELFRDSFRLTPITDARADLILRKPLETRGYTFDDRARTVLIDDLVADYERIEKRRIGRVAPDSEAGQVRYLDASALQLIASHLWETRDQVGRPFSVDHYRSLGREATEKAGTPAQQFLDSYLGDLLDKRQPEKRLQSDALYQLTDGERHRRASSSEVIARELRRMHHDEGLPPTAGAVQEVLKPLRTARIVRSSESPDGVEYELAHDFVVRAAVKNWHELEFLRAKELGRRAQEQEKKEVRLQQLEQRDDTVNMILQIAPLVGIIGMIWSTIALFMGDLKAISFTFAPPGPGLLVYAAFIILLAVGSIGKHRLSIITAAVALVVAVTVTIITAGAQAKVDALNEATMARSSPAVTATTRGSFSPSTTTRPYPVTSTSFPIDYPDSRWAITRTAFRISAGLLTACTIVLLLLFLRSAASLQTSERYSRVLMIMWADFIDLLIYYVPIVITLLILVTGDFNDVTPLVAVILVMFIVRVVFASRLQSTPGLLAAGFRLTTRNQAASHLRRRMQIFVRELASLLWVWLNLVFLLPWLAILPLLLLYRRTTAVDFVSRMDIKERPTEPAQASTKLGENPATAAA
jgi:hypothetical protein